MTGQKYEFARKWKINIVSPRWIDDCISSGYCLQEHLYAVDKPATKGDELRNGLTSTPTGESVQGQVDDVNVPLSRQVHIHMRGGVVVSMLDCQS